MQQFFGYMLTAFWQVLMLALLIAVGFAADKFKIYGKATAVATNNLLFYIITPAVIVNSFLSVKFTAENAKGFLTAALIAIGFHVVMMLVTALLFKKSGEDRPIFRYGAMYGNVGYMGLPLAQAVAGEMGVFYCSAVVAVFNVFAFTHGAMVMSRSDKRIQWKKLIINPGMLGIMIGLPLFLLDVSLPKAVATPISQIGSMNTPLAMMMFGTYLAHTDLLEMFRRKENYIVAALKLIVTPIAFVLLLWAIGVRGDLLLAAAVFSAAPCANNTVMFAAKYGRDTGTASKLCGFTTVLSIITMPVSIALANMIG
ncbi:MAG: AEC family transporter [Clostridia bacterium]|nr:AEC family transporter [Clostridia bacterium]